MKESFVSRRAAQKSGKERERGRERESPQKAAICQQDYSNLKGKLLEKKYKE